MELLAGVAVSVRTYAIDKIYDYLIPDALANQAKPGMRVRVPFSRGNKRYEGVIVRIQMGKRDARCKYIEALLDEQPLLTEAQIRLAAWMKSRFFCTLFDAFRVMLPSGLWFRTEDVCTLATDDKEKTLSDLVTEQEAALVRYMIQAEAAVSQRELCELFGEDSVSALTARGILQPGLRTKRRVGDKTDRIAVLTVDAQEALAYAAAKRKRAPQQAEILRLLADFGEASVKEIAYFTGASAASFRALERLGFLQFRSQEVFRLPELPAARGSRIEQLSAEQQAVFDALAMRLDSGQASAALLHGVTGSGKTAVYIKLLDRVLQQGKQAIVLVPEIALTPQLVAVFRQHFGGNIALLHSSLTLGERSDEWRRVKRGHASIIIGTRSAIFAPVERLGLIIIDEEQESSYKSETTPRYHARDVAKYLCVQSGALLLLGSATPSLETMYSAKQGVYAYYRLCGRFNEMDLPRVLIVDLKKELAHGGSEMISTPLRGELDKNLAAGEQTILFLNRRGTNNLIACPSCGYMHSCPNCSVKLTYHSANRRMMCHYCGFSEPVVERCPECGAQMKFLGIGTQRVEAELQALYPDIQILRMDTDTVSAKRTHEMILSEFEQKRVPILIGTQMVTKGLNFENVTLVGVLAPDAALYSGDYRAQERTFSLITQVVGRAGRGSKAGRAVIQTFTPENEVLRFAAKQDYDSFYEREIQLRRMLHAPPIADLHVLTVSGTDERVVVSCCRELAEALKNACAGLENTRVLGPAPEPVVKVNNRYRYRVCISARSNAQIRALMSGAIKQYSNDKRFKGISVFGDIDPMN